ncbi:MAG: hypothetical protein NT018_07185 [Armatimonadetes bacterium]|nr:hypothetical protein [Armatimonadota bacterium]
MLLILRVASGWQSGEPQICELERQDGRVVSLRVASWTHNHYDPPVHLPGLYWRNRFPQHCALEQISRAI